MYKLEFTLKQHTPLIHFQHEQEGATLRATEVKPKLDKFIIEKQGGWKEIPTGWRIGKENAQHEALDYRLRIIVPSNVNLMWFPEDNKIPLTFPCFFATMGDENKDKYKLCCSDTPIKLEINALNDDLREEILKNICSFFMTHTFGTRQSKGFGFFYPQKESLAFHDTDYYQTPTSTYSFSIDLNQNDNFWEIKRCVFESIDLFYRLLRSGLNRKKGARFISKTINGRNEQISNRGTNYYCKPVIFQYLRSKSTQWDKKTIKSFFFDQDYYKRKKLDRRERELLDNNGIKAWYILERGLPQQKLVHQGSDLLHFSSPEPHFLWRDLFGLSTEESWRSYSMNIGKTHGKKVEQEWCPKGNNDPDKIARFRSPIQFIPYFSDDKKSCSVLFFCNEIPKEYRAATFIVTDGTSSLPLKIGDMNSIEPIIDWLLIPGNFELGNNWVGDTDECMEYTKLNQVLKTLKRSQS
jgi:hypothetical protein